MHTTGEKYSHVEHVDVIEEEDEQLSSALCLQWTSVKSHYDYLLTTSSLPFIDYRLCSVEEGPICLPDAFSSHLAKRLRCSLKPALVLSLVI